MHITCIFLNFIYQSKGKLTAAVKLFLYSCIFSYFLRCSAVNFLEVPVEQRYVVISYRCSNIKYIEACCFKKLNCLCKSAFVDIAYAGCMGILSEQLHKMTAAYTYIFGNFIYRKRTVIILVYIVYCVAYSVFALIL